ncbi:serine/threonine-protein phosphatase PP1-like protein [Tritrichomonas foetus]|uniref:Serine/threonine-protein phosphatase n=1 Tax=Tritrichomonas foetus TaxID=1144522 RepID=A0A1J4KCS6_9EUKA|nr:serine/threonine-protein phosphatase PP1-like protein [Tritrichomonas foetus]|eukprot:OHT09231.1 serine/threonine-protein phosphatase PP1-like protein [Tritrichomonas foetus]
MIDDIFQELLDIKGKSDGVHADLSDCEIFRLCQEVRPIITEEPTLLQLDGPLYIIGDLHGQFQDLLQIFDRLGFPSEDHPKEKFDDRKDNNSSTGNLNEIATEEESNENETSSYETTASEEDANSMPSENPPIQIKFHQVSSKSEKKHKRISKYLFLGDYVDRGKNSIETISLLFCLKIKFPNQVFLLRGNHEISYVNEKYGFLDECSDLFSIDVWRSINAVFNYLPLAAVVNDRIFCVHGGITPNLAKLDDIKNIERPLSFVNDCKEEDLLWSDPTIKLSKYQESERGLGYLFGKSAATKFLKSNKLKMIIRSHEMVDDGYEYPFAPRKRVLTVFSAPNYCGTSGNTGAVVRVTKKRHIEFEFFKSAIKQIKSAPIIKTLDMP